MKLFVALYAFYLVIGVTRFSYYLFVTKNAALSIITENLEVWISLAWKPFGVGVVLSALGAAMIQWAYKSKFYSGKVICRNTWGVAKEINLEDISSVAQYRVPIIGLVRLRVNGSKSSYWLAENAFEYLNTNLAGLTRVKNK